MTFGNLDKMKIKSSEPKYYLGISGKGLIAYMGLNIIRRSKMLKRKFSITEVSHKNLSKTNKVFNNLIYKVYMRKRYKHMPNDSYLYLAQ